MLPAPASISKLAVVLNQELSNTSFIATAQAQAGILNAQHLLLLISSRLCPRRLNDTPLWQVLPRNGIAARRGSIGSVCATNTRLSARLAMVLHGVTLFALALLVLWFVPACRSVLRSGFCPRPPPRITCRLKAHILVAVAVLGENGNLRFFSKKESSLAALSCIVVPGPASLSNVHLEVCRRQQFVPIGSEAGCLSLDRAEHCIQTCHAVSVPVHLPSLCRMSSKMTGHRNTSEGPGCSNNIFCIRRAEGATCLFREWLTRFRCRLQCSTSWRV